MMRVLWFIGATACWLGPSLIYVHEAGWDAAAWTFWVGPLVTYSLLGVATLGLKRLMRRHV